MDGLGAPGRATDHYTMLYGPDRGVRMVWTTVGHWHNNAGVLSWMVGVPGYCTRCVIAEGVKPEIGMWHNV